LKVEDDAITRKKGETVPIGLPTSPASGRRCLAMLGSAPLKRKPLGFYVTTYEEK
jgi:hypothetical protein